MSNKNYVQQFNPQKNYVILLLFKLSNDDQIVTENYYRRKYYMVCLMSMITMGCAI